MPFRDASGDIDRAATHVARAADHDKAASSVAPAHSAHLRRLTVLLGLVWAAAFVLVGLVYRLALYGDGALFAYAVAAQSSWEFHWKNIAARLFVHLFSHLPAEAYVGVTGDAQGGVALYGGLFFAAPLIGLALTYAADRSPGRRLFVGAGLSSALLCPLVFGCPTEVWFAHSLFWPTLALAHYAPRTPVGVPAVIVAFAALTLTHEGALIFAIAIVVTAAVRGPRSGVFGRACVALGCALAVWFTIKAVFPPDDYFAPVLERASRYVIDPANFARPICVLIAVALASYAATHAALRRLSAGRRAIVAGLLVTAALAVYWAWFDTSLHADDRYAVRTVLLVATPLLGVLAFASVLVAEHPGLGRSAPVIMIERCIAALPVHAAMAALVLVTLVYAVETAKYVTAWTRYLSAVRTLATGTISDPALGNPRFVSTVRIPPDLGRLGWNSTTPYLAVMVAPGLLPTRLVIDPSANYIWLSCSTAKESEAASWAVPAESRALVRAHACLHPRTWASSAP